jgi:hypothetical protein
MGWGILHSPPLARVPRRISHSGDFWSSVKAVSLTYSKEPSHHPDWLNQDIFAGELAHHDLTQRVHGVYINPPSFATRFTLFLHDAGREPRAC